MCLGTCPRTSAHQAGCGTACGMPRPAPTGRGLVRPDNDRYRDTALVRNLAVCPSGYRRPHVHCDGATSTWMLSLPNRECHGCGPARRVTPGASLWVSDNSKVRPSHLRRWRWGAATPVHTSAGTSRSEPTGLRCIRQCSMSCCPRPATSPSSMPTIQSKLITAV
jgi:hypothetical protein